MMGTLAMREVMPSRRRGWTQKVRIGGQVVYLCVREYPDGRPGEIFIDVSKQGTFLRGVMDALARMVSISLQCGSGVEVVVRALEDLDYPPNGPVQGSPCVTHCSSVTDWIAAELRARYMPDVPRPVRPAPLGILPQGDCGEGEVEEWDGRGEVMHAIGEGG